MVVTSMCDPKYLPFPLGEWTGQEMEWSWRHQRLKVENFYQEVDGEWITDPTQMPYLTIFGLFIEIWTVCSLEEAHGNGKS